MNTRGKGSGRPRTMFLDWLLKTEEDKISYDEKKAQVLGIAPLNMRSMCQRRFTIVEVTDQHWL